MDTELNEAQKKSGHFVSSTCIGEICRMCQKPATHKVGEEVADDDPHLIRHNYTAYVCCGCFAMIFGQHSHPEYLKAVVADVMGVEEYGNLVTALREKGEDAMGSLAFLAGAVRWATGPGFNLEQIKQAIRDYIAKTAVVGEIHVFKCMCGKHKCSFCEKSSSPHAFENCPHCGCPFKPALNAKES
jgi:hypothetical protein